MKKCCTWTRWREDKGIPLIIDNAYGTPFPDIIYTEAKPRWNDNTVVCMSLSKFGLPNLRTGIVIAREEIASAIADINGVMHLAPGGIGARLAMDLVRNGEIMQMSREIVQPFYHRKAHRTPGTFPRGTRRCPLPHP